ncbi:MAG: polymer-forming cytoskeletal protein [Nitrospira sp.]|nr:polymer-forming cytoskeletal protein [Nitrospira sp.]MCP9465549.1 polymer-forming cytoskeletal protein [Nitrospira sp.]
MWKQDKPDGSPSTGQDVDALMTPARSQRTEMGEEISAFVGRGVDFKGTITYQGTVRIDGTVEGEIQTDGILLVGEEAVLKAKVTAGTIVCKGKITGDILAKDKIKLRTPAVITGGVKTPMLSMEEGVMFNGTLEMTAPARDAQRESGLRAIPQAEQPVVKRITA